MGRVNRVIIIPGNGCVPIRQSNWYYWLAKEIKEKGGEGVEVECRDMPDPYEAKESIWIPFILNDLKSDENTILIGHSSGAEAAMRLIENNKVVGVFLISACHTDLGMESEEVSGYYNRDWQWNKMKENTKWIIQYGSTDDPFIPFEEMEEVANQTGSQFIKHNNRGHYMTRTFPDLLQHLLSQLLIENSS